MNKKPKTTAKAKCGRLFPEDPGSASRLQYVISSDGTHKGRFTGVTRVCRLEGCTGVRVGVRWDDGKLTYPCSKGMRWSRKCIRATII